MYCLHCKAKEKGLGFNQNDDGLNTVESTEKKNNLTFSKRGFSEHFAPMLVDWGKVTRVTIS